jgi:Ca2+-binding EF-hand superfamily protein
MMKTTLIAGLFLSAAAVPLLAQGMMAEDGPGGPGAGRGMMMFEEFDANGDGKVTQDEIDARREARFAEVDANGDGQVSLDEFTAQAAKRATERAKAMFERLDVDGDGMLSQDVLALRQGRGGPDGSRMIAMLDTDGDGAISEEEFQAAMDRRAEMRGEHGHGGRGHGGMFGKHRN